ncbi:unnamed protein product [Caenorhabditis angaria]|uniref:tRNA (adenine(58)-N(1))-methyltransferase non-catalytic subunit TRM6 n=1 Tax=Caenorhabditis angaria TaxID=860376 RepID=A0A9P1I3R9_9PELO|nr:unnamed protein product [Caenorhabditis angaria]
MDQKVIENGEYLIVQKVDGEQIRVMRFTPKQKILIEKLKFDADNAFGKPYGLFEIVGGDCIPMTAQKLRDEIEEQDAALSVMSKKEDLTTGDSVDSSCEEKPSERVVIAPSALKLEPEQKRQKLVQDEVLEMKKQGTTGNELVAKLVEGSASFNTRTTYSQSKYIKRKSKKHSDRVLILRPTIRLLAKSYYMKDPDRIAMLRNDQLGLILQMAGIHHSKNVIVFEQNLGLITSAIIERLGGKGACIHIHRGAIAQSIPCVHSMNYDEQTLSTFLPVRIGCVLAGKQLPYDNQRKNGTDEEDLDVRAADVKELTAEEEEALVRRNDRLAKEKLAMDLIENGQTHSLIIGSRTIDPINVLEQFYHKLAPASTIVIYSPHLNVLVESYEWLVKNYAINLNITNQMCRVLQVLPDRTHPLMSQHIAGGHILSAIKVLSAENSS